MSDLHELERVFGRDGRDGRDGEDGLDGAPGPRGAPGIKGIDGKDGSRGLDGRDGADGVNGKDGRDGIDGKDGAPGRRGVIGPQGERGPEGPQGERGPEGEPGPIGPMPDHEWHDTKLRFEAPDGKWGPFVDLKGPKGERGRAGQLIGGGGSAGSGDSGMSQSDADLRYLKLTGGTLTGTLMLDDDPVLPLQAATKQYVDAHSGGEGSGNTILNGEGPPGAEVSILDAQTPVTTGATDSSILELGTVFQVSEPGYITAIRYWRDAGDTADNLGVGGWPHVGSIWDDAGTLLASQEFTAEADTGDGWFQQDLDTPLAVIPGVDYVVSVASIFFVLTAHGYDAPIVNGAVTGTLGVFATGKGTFPTSSFNASNYFRDIVFSVPLDASNGDFYLDTDADAIYGPLTDDGWGDPTSLIGPEGPAGATGPGVATGGTSGQVLAKNSATDFDTHWIDPPSGYTDEQAQDAIGAMVDGTLAYTDATPLLSRAALTGAITASAGSNTTALGSFTKAQLDTAVSDGNVLYVGDVSQYTDEQAQDAIGAAIAAGSQSGITVTYDDAANKIDFTVSGGTVVLDTYSGNASTTAFTLSQNPGTENNTQVFISGVYQDKAQYSVSGTTLTFSAAPPSGTGNIEVVQNPTAPLASLSGFTSDNLTEGSTNKFLTASKTTDNLTEGSTNLYFTNARAISAVGPTLGTPVTLPSATVYDYTVPSTAKLIIVSLIDFSTSSTFPMGFQLGTSGGIDTTNSYKGSAGRLSAANPTAHTTQFSLQYDNTAGANYSGQIQLALANSSTNTWSMMAIFTQSASGQQVYWASGYKTLSAALTKIRFTMDGSATFDAGSVNILYF